MSITNTNAHIFTCTSLYVCVYTFLQNFGGCVAFELQLSRDHLHMQIHALTLTHTTPELTRTAKVLNSVRFV